MDEKSKWSVGEGGELPIGFGLNLAADGNAMDVFAHLSEEEKQKVVEESRQQHTREDMEQFVNQLGNKR